MSRHSEYLAGHPYRDCGVDKAPKGWYCTRVVDHPGPCAAEPTGLNRLFQRVRVAWRGI